MHTNSDPKTHKITKKKAKREKVNKIQTRQGSFPPYVVTIVIIRLAIGFSVINLFIMFTDRIKLK